MLPFAGTQYGRSYIDDELQWAIFLYQTF